MIAAFSLGFFVLVSGLSAAPSSAPASDDDNPYGVDAPKLVDTAKSAPKVTAPAPVASEKPTKDSVAAAKVAKAKAVKDSVAEVKKKSVAVKDSLKAAKLAAKKDSVAKVVAKKDSTKALAKKDSVALQKKDTALAKTAIKDTLLGVKKDSVVAPAVAAAKPVDTTAKAADSAHATRKSKPRLVRETTINTINQMKGNYRSPKRALFMSLVIPGLGQAYVGQSTFNYARAAAYLSTDILMGVLWYHYVVVKHDRVVKNYHHFADTFWSQSRYEDGIANHLGTGFDLRNPTRAVEKGYCDAVLAPGDPSLVGCKDPVTVANKSSYDNFNATVHLQDNLSADSIGLLRSGFTDPYQFYEMIGQEQEFITGWQRLSTEGSIVFTDSTIVGTSALRNQYISMRAQANRYSRMQAWFVGGMVLNHIVSALDAALTARYNNKRLYESNAMWYDRLHLDGGLAFDQGWPKTNVTASLSF